MQKNEMINVFVHIPKTAGQTFKKTLEVSGSKDTFLRTSFNYFEPYVDIQTGKTCFYSGNDSFTNYITSLSQVQKNSVTCIGGHDSYYGIHELFNKTPRYFAFFREPVSRTISLYNYERMVFEIYSKKQGALNPFEKYFVSRFKDHFFIDGRVPSFEEWLTESYDKKTPFYYSMDRYLDHLNFSHSNDLSDVFKKFYFVGITEHFDQDAAFLYHELGVKKFAFDSNASLPFISRKEMSIDLINKIKDANVKDFLLYEAAIKENERFKKAHETFSFIIKNVQAKKSRYLFRRSIYDSILRLTHPFVTRVKSKLKTYPFFVRLNRLIKEGSW